MSPPDTNRLPALIKANNYHFYSEGNGENDLSKMYKEWRAKLPRYEVPRLCRLERHETNRQPLAVLPCRGCGNNGSLKDAVKNRLIRHSASSPPTYRLGLPGKKGDAPNFTVQAAGQARFQRTKTLVLCL
ncbi:hypothetical protein BV898_13603 [Hypsibius exemplaris]|uniref:Uncharacterized protein n=1 Tax=Hypsibius exemplaris TaxID=2072580 RepID=A0A1W0WA92_HYPEX|nr:hypothetical protein BV898_13603 [Hypsibius exemplaris]